jgi:N-acetylglucosamine-6-sulfatase
LRRTLSFAVVGLLAALLPVPTATAEPVERPNVLLIVTDDQPANTLWAMPTVQSELIAKGASYSNAFAPTAQCCPSRASILTGTYAHTHGVWDVNAPYAFSAFNDSSTIATWMDAAGYRTGMFGKYLNGYNDEDATYVPPGWDEWRALFHDTEGEANRGSYFNFNVSENGYPVQNSSDYVTDYLAAEAAEFVTDSRDPFFLYFSTTAPHRDAVPAPRHEGTFADLAPYRPPNFNEANIADKPAWVQKRPLLTQADIARDDQLRIDMHETLLAVDEAIQRLLTATNGEPTLIIFMTDNGYVFGEHRLRGKNDAYEGSMRLPLILRQDGVIAAGVTDDRLALNVDIAQTIGEATGVPTPETEGLPLMGTEVRSRFAVEAMSGGRRPAYCGVRTKRELFVHYASGEEEFYNLRQDPYQLMNRASAPAVADKVQTLRASARRLCDPLAPGMTAF